MKLLYIIWMIFFAQQSFAQVTDKKCKTRMDEELGIEVYDEIDSAAVPLDVEAFNKFLSPKTLVITDLSKRYMDDQMVRFAYVIGKDGKASLVKVLDPKNDKQIEDAVKHLITLIPLHKPCKCGNKPVPCTSGVTFRLYPSSSPTKK